MVLRRNGNMALLHFSNKIPRGEYSTRHFGERYPQPNQRGLSLKGQAAYRGKGVTPWLFSYSCLIRLPLGGKGKGIGFVPGQAINLLFSVGFSVHSPPSAKIKFALNQTQIQHKQVSALPSYHHIISPHTNVEAWAQMNSEMGSM